MSKVDFELNRDGVRAFLQGKECTDMVNRIGKAVYGGVDPAKGYEMTSGSTGQRAFCKVAAATPHAINSERKHNTLLKALHNGKSAL